MSMMFPQLAKLLAEKEKKTKRAIATTVIAICRVRTTLRIVSMRCAERASAAARETASAAWSSIDGGIATATPFPT